MPNLKKISKKLCLIFFDFFLVLIATLLAYFFRYESFLILKYVDLTNIFIPAFLFVIVVYLSNFYSTLTRFLSFDFFQLLKIFSLFSFSYFLYVFVFSSKINIFFDMNMVLGLNPPRSTVFSIPMTLFFLFLFSRQLIFYFINSIIKKYKANSQRKINCVIYGAGDLGNQLNNYISRYENNYKIKSIIDDNSYLQGQYINKIKIVSFNKFIKNFSTSNILVFIAINNNSKVFKDSIYKKFSDFKNIRLVFISQNNGVLNPLSVNPTDIDIDYILGYTENLDIRKLKLIENKNILVTGGGGSIGSELVKQIYEIKPKSISIVDNNEHNLFKITHHFKNYTKKQDKIKLNFILGNLANVDFVKELFKKNFDLVFHSAAYKHVSLVENNILSSVDNNIMSTLNLCKLSKDKVGTFVNVSSDKAVRPKNFMGATKNVTEQIVKKFNNISKKTSFYSVRFGNVLNSSGSVIPIFKDQILHNKDLTITNLKVTRYFMSINEAISLILKTLTLNNDGKTFYFDMGKPVKIIDLAKKIANFYGKNLTKKSKNINEIGYKVIGLSKGEKLNEILTTPKSILVKTEEKKILSIRNNKKNNMRFNEQKLLAILKSRNSMKIKKYIFKITRNVD